MLAMLGLSHHTSPGIVPPAPDVARTHDGTRTREVHMGEIKRLVLEEDAQTTAEYALVILGAAAVASVLIAWVSKGDLIKNFFSKVFNKLTNAI